MRKTTGALAIMLAALMMVSLVCLPASAEEVPGATVSELTGAGLTRTLSGVYEFGGTSTLDPNGIYTMAKGVSFSANSLDASEYDKYYCDFELTLNSPGGSVDGSQFFLIGNYVGYGNIGVTMDGATVVDGRYPLLSTFLPDVPIDYEYIRESVGTFECGIVDFDLPVGTKVTIQLVMYPTDARGDHDAAILVGDPIVYYKAPPIEITKIDAFIGNDGLGYLRFISTINYKENQELEYFGTWFIPQNLMHDMKKKLDIQYDTDDTGAVASGETYSADILGIPSTQLNRVITGVSYIKLVGDQEEIRTDAKTASVMANKNETSN